MNVALDIIGRDKFCEISSDIHEICFGVHRPSDFERFHYAIICKDETGKMTAYSTIIEHDADSAYMQHGGTFPDIPKLFVVKSYLMMLKYLREKYKYISTRIYNTNIEMLKLAFTGGFVVHGVEYMKETPDNEGGILLCLSIDGSAGV